MKKDVSKIRIALVLVSVFLLLSLIASGVWFFFFKKQKQDPVIYYYPANYDLNIFEDSVYMGYTRDLFFGDSNVMQLFSYENDYESASEECQFFLDYFQTVIRGDSEKLPNFHVPDFFEEAPKFTMQMIYDPYVCLNSVKTELVNGEEVSVYNYYVRYMIRRNNGTFRTGVASNTAIPQIYQLIRDSEGHFKILNIFDIQMKNDD